MTIFINFADIRTIFPFELFHLGGDEVNTGQSKLFFFIATCQIIN